MTWTGARLYGTVNRVDWLAAFIERVVFLEYHVNINKTGRSQAGSRFIRASSDRDGSCSPFYLLTFFVFLKVFFASEAWCEYGRVFVFVRVSLRVCACG